MYRRGWLSASRLVGSSGGGGSSGREDANLRADAGLRRCKCRHPVAAGSRLWPVDACPHAARTPPSPPAAAAQVHQAVVASGARFSGPTIHFVDEEYDTGGFFGGWVGGWAAIQCVRRRRVGGGVLRSAMRKRGHSKKVRCG